VVGEEDDAQEREEEEPEEGVAEEEAELEQRLAGSPSGERDSGVRVAHTTM
jgi:hypothetical protein